MDTDGTSGPNRYGLNVGQLIADYGGRWIITGTALGYAAQRRGTSGRGFGQRLGALTLDQLAAVMDRDEREW